MCLVQLCYCERKDSFVLFSLSKLVHIQSYYDKQKKKKIRFRRRSAHLFKFGKRKQNNFAEWEINFKREFPYTSLSGQCTVPETKIAELANSVDLDEVAHNEPPHLELYCLGSNL